MVEINVTNDFGGKTNDSSVRPVSLLYLLRKVHNTSTERLMGIYDQPHGFVADFKTIKHVVNEWPVEFISLRGNGLSAWCYGEVYIRLEPQLDLSLG